MRSASEVKLLTVFGKRVGQFRRAKNMTQEQLAEKAGVTSLTIGYIEQGRQWPRIATLQRIAKSLEITVAELFKDL